MTSEEYDAYIKYIKKLDNEELDLECECAFVQINDEDESIKYDLCVKESHERSFRYGK